jgi:hypothetical protein
MFLAAVMQAHTDSQAFSIADDVYVGQADAAQEEDMAALPERLEAALAVPAAERVQRLLPEAHRSRWI